MNIEAAFKKYNDLTGDVAAAASLVLAEAISGRAAATPTTGDRPMTVAQAAERFNLPKRSIYNAVASGKLTHSRAGRAVRIKPSDLEQFLAGQETESDWQLPSYTRR